LINLSFVEYNNISMIYFSNVLNIRLRRGSHSLCNAIGNEHQNKLRQIEAWLQKRIFKCITFNNLEYGRHCLCNIYTNMQLDGLVHFCHLCGHSFKNVFYHSSCTCRSTANMREQWRNTIIKLNNRVQLLSP
jgi:hypothetical protein